MPLITRKSSAHIPNTSSSSSSSQRRPAPTHTLSPPPVTDLRHGGTRAERKPLNLPITTNTLTSPQPAPDGAESTRKIHPDIASDSVSLLFFFLNHWTSERSFLKVWAHTCPRDVLLISRKPEKNAEEKREMKEKKKRMLRSAELPDLKTHRAELRFRSRLCVSPEGCAQIKPFVFYPLIFILRIKVADMWTWVWVNLTKPVKVTFHPKIRRKKKLCYAKACFRTTSNFVTFEFLNKSLKIYSFRFSLL